VRERKTNKNLDKVIRIMLVLIYTQVNAR